MDTSKQRVKIFFVSEEEYPKLQAACPGDFPYTYAQFVDRVAAGTEAMGDQVEVVKVHVRVAEFLEWCRAEKRPPDNRARSAYALQAAAGH